MPPITSLVSAKYHTTFLQHLNEKIITYSRDTVATAAAPEAVSGTQVMEHLVVFVNVGYRTAYMIVY